MVFRRRRQRDTPHAQLLAAAGFVTGAVGREGDASRGVAFVVMRRGSAAVGPTLAAVEELLADEAAYEFAMTFLEQVQNVVSHGSEIFLAPEEVEPLLGPRSAVVWRTLADFWAAVAAWSADNRPLESSADIRSVENERLRAILWTGNRTLPTGAKVGLADAVRYERATGVGIPGFSHVAAALRAMGQD